MGSSVSQPLLPALANLISRAADGSQVLVTTHSQVSAEHLGRRTRRDPIVLKLIERSTRVRGGKLKAAVGAADDFRAQIFEPERSVEVILNRWCRPLSKSLHHRTVRVNQAACGSRPTFAPTVRLEV